MVATARIPFPDDMIHPGSSDILTLESLATDTFARVKDYAREQPAAFALWAFGLGFVIGWKLKPW